MNVLQRLRRSATIALILSPAGLLIIAVVRLLLVSNYNTDTALGIVASGGYVDTLLGTIIPAIPILLPYIGLTLLFFRRAMPGILAIVAGLLISPAGVSGASALELAQNNWRRALWSGTELSIEIPLVIGLLLVVLPYGLTEFAKTVGVVVSLALLPYVLHLYPLVYDRGGYSAQLRRPWLPADTITLKSHQEMAGYMLPSNGDWLVFLREDTREIVYYPPGEVIKRQACRMEKSQAVRPLIALTASSLTAPDCANHRAG